MKTEQIEKIITDWEQYKKAHWYESDSVNVEAKLMNDFAHIYSKTIPSPSDEEIDSLKEKCKKLEFMIENGLGWDDMKNDITMPHEL